jgi:TOTE conflict system, Archaeo-Eukaryotic Primase domain/Type III restriction enzyme, res subunit
MSSPLRESAEDMEIPVLVERSRSADGAHVWVLFAEAVAARVARSVGSVLLTQAMSRSAIATSSYDRLFPNQDTMPTGGFGNLIALPLQHARRSDGCTVFLGPDLEPHPDQWTYLASIERLPASRACQSPPRQTVPEERWACDHPRTGTGRPSPDSGRRPRPMKLRSQLAGRVQIATSNLPPELSDRLRRRAAFANPVFFERERARLSTHNTPRVIGSYEQSGAQLRLPRGCLDSAISELHAYGIKTQVADVRNDGIAITATFNGTLLQDQLAAVNALDKHDIGVPVAPPGAGKTVIATALIASRARATLILVHRRPLLEQWSHDSASFLTSSPTASARELTHREPRASTWP